MLARAVANDWFTDLLNDLIFLSSETTLPASRVEFLQVNFPFGHSRVPNDGSQTQFNW
jgi:hypothetical protein